MLKLSVCMITYNHAESVSKAIESILAQKVSFQYEIIIGDDCSKDSTRSVLLDYCNRYPNLIRLILNEVNLGPTRNFANVLKSACGEYIAILEGDDYWTSPVKLRTQVDILEASKDISICFHAVQVVDKDGVNKNLVLPLPQYRKKISSLIDLMSNYSFMATCSLVFRNRLFEYFPDVFFTSDSMCDWPLNVLNAEHGDIYYCNEIMASYRQQSSLDAWTSKGLDVILDHQIRICKAFNNYFDKKFEPLIDKNIRNWNFDLSKYHLVRFYFKEARKCYLRSMSGELTFLDNIRWYFVISPIYALKGVARKAYHCIRKFYRLVFGSRK